MAIRVKVCGLTDPAEAAAVASLGADWIGLNFHPGSPRFVDDHQARRLIETIAGRPSQAVGLFVDRPAAEVAQRSRRLGLSIVQLHGQEPPADVAHLAGAGLRVVRAFRLATVEAVDAMWAYAAACDAQATPLEAALVDAFVPGQAGGTGRVIAQAVIERLTQSPHPLRLILAGGLTPENVAALAARVQPWMVDVASGVERAPGRKDLDRVQRFVAAVRKLG